MIDIRLAKNSGGKAGKGMNKTSSVQVVRDNIILKQFRFKVRDSLDYQNAIQSALKFMRNLKEGE